MRKTSLLVVLAIALVACGSGGTPEDARIATTGEIAIIAPEPGAVFTAEAIPVELSLTGATILEEASTTITADTGHIHVSLDDKVISLLLTGFKFDLVELAGGSIEPGTHLLRVEFVAADHGPFSPREMEVVTFTVQ